MERSRDEAVDVVLAQAEALKPREDPPHLGEPAGAGMDVCVVSASLLYKVRGGMTQANRRVVAARHIMPVGVAHACTGSDRQYLIAAIAQQLGRFLAMVVPDGDKGGAKMMGGEAHWDDTLPASSGINVGCMAPPADE